MHKLTPRLRFLVVANLGMGFLRLLEPPTRTQSYGFTIAKDVMPLRDWGWLFLGLGMLVWVVSVFWANKVLAVRVVVLFAGCFGWLFWGIASFISAVHTGKSSFSGSFMTLLILWVHGMVVRRAE